MMSRRGGGGSADCQCLCFISWECPPLYSAMNGTQPFVLFKCQQMIEEVTVVILHLNCNVPETLTLSCQQHRKGHTRIPSIIAVTFISIRLLHRLRLCTNALIQFWIFRRTHGITKYVQHKARYILDTKSLEIIF